MELQQVCWTEKYLGVLLRREQEIELAYVWRTNVLSFLISCLCHRKTRMSGAFNKALNCCQLSRELYLTYGKAAVGAVPLVPSSFNKFYLFQWFNLPKVCFLVGTAVAGFQNGSCMCVQVFGTVRLLNPATCGFGKSEEQYYPLGADFYPE